MPAETIYPVKDTSIQEFKPDRNWGTSPLEFSEYEYAVWRAFLGFDISSAPSSADVSSVTLHMFVRNSMRFHDSPGTIHRITGSWEESTATWNNSKDIKTSGLVLARTFGHAEYEPIWDVQDVTALYKEAKDAGDVLDLQLRTSESYRKGYYRGNEFDSREARVYTDQKPYALQMPYLLVTYAPAIFQYEVIFDIGHPALVDTRALLEAEYAKYYKATAWNITPADPDCFDRLQALGGGLDQTWETGWLCQAIEYGESPCAPLPYWLCPLPTPETIYMRGECSCSNFRDNLQPLGIPCMHLIAARIYYGNEPPWCPYIPCA